MNRFLYLYSLFFMFLLSQFLLANNEKSKVTHAIESGDIDEIVHIFNEINWQNQSEMRIHFYAGLLQKQIADQKINENQLKSKLSLQQISFLFDQYEPTDDDSGYFADKSASQSEDTDTYSSGDFIKEESSMNDPNKSEQANIFLSILQKHPKAIVGACGLSSAVTLVCNHMVRIVRKRMKQKQAKKKKQNKKNKLSMK